MLKNTWLPSYNMESLEVCKHSTKTLLNCLKKLSFYQNFLNYLIEVEEQYENLFLYNSPLLAKYHDIWDNLHKEDLLKDCLHFKSWLRCLTSLYLPKNKNTMTDAILKKMSLSFIKNIVENWINHKKLIFLEI